VAIRVFATEKALNVFIAKTI